MPPPRRERPTGPGHRVTRKAHTQTIHIMAVDPGTTTGVASATLPLKRGLAWPGLESAPDWESWDVTGPPGRQAWEIMSRARALHTAFDRFVLVFESFQLRITHGTAPLIDPVRVIAACEGRAYDQVGDRWIEFVFQQASSKTFANNERLRSHGLWVAGSSEHRRDAIRHVCKHYADIVSKYGE